ncbi:MAG: thiolase family protein [Anaerorhabdus sp.]
MEEKIVFVSPCRSAIGKVDGALSSLSSVDLCVKAINSVIDRSGLKKNDINHVVIGSALQAGCGQNIARQAIIKAELPHKTVGQTINMVCGSGLQAVNTAVMLIKTNQAEVVIAGGVESMSNAPHILQNVNKMKQLSTGAVLSSIITDGLWENNGNYHMGITAENLAEKYLISREEQDKFALESQEKYRHALENERFKDEIFPMVIETKGEKLVFDRDEHPRNVTIESLSRLNPVFKQNGTVTVGNSSGVNDGVAMVLVMSEKKAKELGVTPIAVWKDTSCIGVDPKYMGIGPALATEELLNKNEIGVNDLDLIESNEAFAAQSLAVEKYLNWDRRKVNVNGGAISLGHPLGASGCRILVTLLHELNREKYKLGLATLCIGGGMGIAMLVERYNDEK